MDIKNLVEKGNDILSTFVEEYAKEKALPKEDAVKDLNIIRDGSTIIVANADDDREVLLVIEFVRCLFPYVHITLPDEERFKDTLVLIMSLQKEGNEIYLNVCQS